MNKAVTEIGKMNFEGNIIPMAWFSRLTFENGKPNTVAIVCLSEIIYWYRPVEIRDEATGKVKSYRQKFKADKWQCSYEALADRFGFTKNQVRNALHFLEEQGYVTLEFRHFTVADGTPLSNVLFIEPVPHKIVELNVIPTTTSDHIDTGIEMGGDVDVEVDTISTQESTHPHTEVDTYTETPTEIPKHDDVRGISVSDSQIGDDLFIDLAGFLAEIGMATAEAQDKAIHWLADPKIGPEVCRRQLEVAETRFDLARASKNGLKNPVGYFCRSVEKDWPPPVPTEKKKKRWFSEEEEERFFYHGPLEAEEVP